MDFFREFGRFLLARKKYWLFPILISMLLLGGLVFYSKGSALAPFIYTVF